MDHRNSVVATVFTANDAQALLDEFAGTGQHVAGEFGKAGFKERVDFGFVVGKYVDMDTGEAINATNAIIHYSKKGAHIVPSRP